MRESELLEVLQEIGLRKVRKHVGRKGVNYQFCCPFHIESKPSAGIVLENNSAYGQCFSCKETFSVAKLVAKMLDVSIYEGTIWLQEKYNVTFRYFEADEKTLRRYDDATEGRIETFQRHELPYFKLAPFRSGKETHSYFFERGFDWDDVREHMIGWDRALKRVTIPVFHPDGVLCGFSGRAVLEQKIDGRLNPAYKRLYGDRPKYYIYDNFPISQVLYGSHNYKSNRKRAIIVEGMFDRIWMYKQGFPEALSIIVAKMSNDHTMDMSHQKNILHKLGVEEVIFAHDNDEAGQVGKEVAYDILKNDFMCFDTQYPDDFKDPVGMSRQQIQSMIDNKWRYGRQKGRLRRYE